MNNSVGIKQIIQGFIALIVLIALVWLAFYALILVLVIAAIASAYFFVRRFLTKQGFITPDTPNTPPAEPNNADATVIETEYTDVTEGKKDDAP